MLESQKGNYKEYVSFCVKIILIKTDILCSFEEIEQTNDEITFIFSQLAFMD